MYKLQLLNVIKFAHDENAKSKYLAQGFKLVEEKKEEIKIDKVVKEKEETDYSEMTVQDLQALCKEKGLTGYSNLVKDDLVKFVQENIK